MTKRFPYSMVQANTTATANEELTKKGKKQTQALFESDRPAWNYHRWRGALTQIVSGDRDSIGKAERESGLRFIWGKKEEIFTISGYFALECGFNRQNVSFCIVLSHSGRWLSTPPAAEHFEA
ncbi:hypothetical protein FVEG_16636 [Fusarium verticillioides 7600]|uniref:Uncharacterized protein n=1 Tax=Gibberella moniliformis (strain M3125 / FGSC 7600) TaxID=334819 RepID=W7N165_GIBM7|nr:hypothetical protein FVEG_16636 [Fusarium verticillioides 7600]XP_018756663.1 hypothetical protein FVEG_16636 [Fusarium verticillioides 7600]EWG50471.1 hypothetical protein FVEG_16636 [Fusarium verticillioides 7600]EWG50472.1 hypothetical protein FVEG_16636 [Fusarium verticillioides 7600]